MKLTRRLFALFLVMALLLSCGALPALADPEEENAGELILPASTRIIGPQAFRNDTSITEVVLPQGVTEIQSQAFAYSAVKKINLPSSLTFIADDAFEGAQLLDVTAEPDSYAFGWAAQRGLVALPIPVDFDSFPDFAFRAFVADIIDTDHDGSLSLAERKAVTKISVPMAGIVNLAGIELFPKLRELDCSNNELCDLYVGDNVLLERLIISGCGVGSLDVSRNLSLKRLMCSANELGTLDVSLNTALRRLDCVDCGLESLDVSQNSALTALNCSDNLLGTLDVKHNPALESLACQRCVLSALDLSGNPQLTVLDCSMNRLRALDLSANTRLGAIYCGHNRLTALDTRALPLLAALSCESNRISSLDLSENGLLTNLIVSDNALTSLDVSDTPELWSLCCEGNAIETLDIRNCERMSLDYERGVCDSQDSYTVYRYSAGKGLLILRMPPNVAVQASFPALEINEVYFPDKAFRQYVAQKLDTNYDDELSEEEIAAVTSLNLSGLGIVSLAGIQYFTNLERLVCAGSLRPLTAGKLEFVNLQYNTKLRYLDLSFNPLTNLHTETLPLLETLKLDLSLVESLYTAQNPALRTLSVRNGRLRSLDLGENSALCSLDCRGNPGLSTLDLRGCPVLLAACHEEASSDGNGGLIYTTPVAANCTLAVDEGLYIVSDPDAPELVSYYSPNMQTNSVFYVYDEPVVSNTMLVTSWTSSEPAVAQASLRTGELATTGGPVLRIDSGSMEGYARISGYDENGRELLRLNVYVRDPFAISATGMSFYTVQEAIRYQANYGEEPLTLLKDMSYRFLPGEKLVLGELNGHIVTASAAKDCTLKRTVSGDTVTYTCERKEGSAVSLLRDNAVIARSDYLNDVIALAQDGDLLLLSGDAKADRSCTLPPYISVTLLLNGHKVKSNFAIQLQSGTLLKTDFTLDEGEVEIEYLGWPSYPLRCDVADNAVGIYKISADTGTEIPHYTRAMAVGTRDFFTDNRELRDLSMEITYWDTNSSGGVLTQAWSNTQRGIYCSAAGRAAAGAWRDTQLVAIVHYTVG